MNSRDKMAEQLEVVSDFFMIDGIQDLMTEENELAKDDPHRKLKIKLIHNKLIATGIKKGKRIMDKLIALFFDKTADEVDGMSDAEYAQNLRLAIGGLVNGFFGS